jgi:hypothetical protein
MGMGWISLNNTRNGVRRWLSVRDILRIDIVFRRISLSKDDDSESNQSVTHSGDLVSLRSHLGGSEASKGPKAHSSHSEWNVGDTFRWLSVTQATFGRVWGVEGSKGPKAHSSHSELNVGDTGDVIWWSTILFCSLQNKQETIKNRIISLFQSFPNSFYLPHMEYEGSIGFVSRKMKIFYCLFSRFRTFYS